jgi:endonuclease/exonuclease/phosphatase family metal-dependent hydrolase
MRIVSFNIAFAMHVDRAIDVLTADSTLRNADVVTLQEMDEAGTRKIAETLGMSYAYYPATFSLVTRRDFGNAVLSRWPIVEDSKILLPHVSRFRKTQRTATAATIRVGDTLVRVYSAHLGTLADVGPNARRNQLRAILADATPYPRVVIAGDMNNGGIGRVAREMGYEWPTESGPPTIRLWRYDHIFLKGLALPDTAAAGAVLDVRGASDHRPVWAVGVLR